MRNEKRIDNFHRERVQSVEVFTKFSKSTISIGEFELIACSRVVAMLSSDTESTDDSNYVYRKMKHVLLYLMQRKKTR